MATIGVIGANGMLGYAVSEYFRSLENKIVATTRNEFDIVKDPIGKLENILRQTDFVVNCAGVIKPRIAGLPVEDVVKVNSIFPRNLAGLCRQRDIPCFHITTDCVYSGKKGQYTEKDYFDAEDLYGMTKNAGERGDCMVLRTSIIGEEKEQSRSLLEWARANAGKEVSGFTNHQWNGVTTVYLAQMIEKILHESKYQNGIIHLHSPNTVTKYELLQTLSEVYQLSLSIKSAEAKELCNRSLASIYSLSKEIATKTIRQQIVEMKEFFFHKANAMKAA